MNVTWILPPSVKRPILRREMAALENQSLTKERATRIANQLESWLRDLLSAWFPRCIDDVHGGFLADFDYRWQPRGDQDKMLEFQARTTRAIAQAAALPGFESYAKAAAHGFEYLRDVMWDAEYGGWYRMRDRKGKSLEYDTKHGHSISYSITACLAYHRLCGDPGSLQLAKQGYEWLDTFGYDRQYGGYFPLYLRDGRVVKTASDHPAPNAVRDCIGTPFGFKDFNTLLDIFSALIEFHQEIPDSLTEKRLAELTAIMRDRATVAPGAVHVFYHPDWTPVPDFTRTGFGLTLSYYLPDAEKALGSPAPCASRTGLSDSRTSVVAKSLVDNVLNIAWDRTNGGVYYGGSAFGAAYLEDTKILLDQKIWWPQAEAMSALLTLALTHEQERSKYLRSFEAVTQYIDNNIIDHVFGGWRSSGLDYDAKAFFKPKSQLWKDCSHEVLALVRCIKMLRSFDG